MTTARIFIDDVGEAQGRAPSRSKRVSIQFPGETFQPLVESWNLEAEQLRVGTIASKLLKLLDRGKSFRKQFSNFPSPYLPTPGDKPQENVSNGYVSRSL